MGDVVGAQRSQKSSSSARQTFSRIAGRWLRWQCQLLNDVHFAAVVDATGLHTGAGVTSKHIVASIGKARVPIICTGDSAKHHSFSAHGMNCWQLPVQFPGKSICVIVHMNALSAPAQTGADRLLRWGIMNLTDWLADAQSDSKQSMPPLQLMLSQKTLTQAAGCWVDDLQFRTQAKRVSVGWFEHGRSRLLAMSGVTALDARRSLPRTLIAAMGECVHAQQPIQYPAIISGIETDLIHHQRLHKRYGELTVLSLPLVKEEQILGVVTLELSVTQKRALHAEALSDEMKMATPILATLSERKPGVGLFLKRCGQTLLHVLFKPTTQAQKTASFTALALTLLALFFPFSHNATLRGEIQGADRQVLAATHQGYLASVSARAGDQVSEGQVLAQFDHTSMQLQRDSWVSELVRLDSALVQAMSTRDKPAIGRLRAEQASAKAELDLINHQLSQADIVAPFDGILVSGDLNDRLGSSVDAGESLFQIASLNDYNLTLEVPEHQATNVSLGSIGNMRFAAFPSKEYAFKVESTVPIAIASENENVFRMQAGLQGDTAAIRPGMTGVAKVRVGRRSFAQRGLDLLRVRLRYWWWSIGA